MGTDQCNVCGKSAGEAVLCFKCNCCPAHCKCKDTVFVPPNITEHIDRLGLPLPNKV